MFPQTIYRKLEITFWDIIIPIMSNSPAFRKVFRHIYLAFRDHANIAWAPPFILAWAGLGLVTGLLLGHTGISLR